MVVNGCLLDEAYGDTIINHKKKKKNKGNEEKKYIEIDKHFKDSSDTIKPHVSYYTDQFNTPIPRKNDGSMPNHNLHETINNPNITQKHKTLEEKQDELKKEKIISEYYRIINDKSYNEFLNNQLNKHNKTHSEKIIEGFQNVNDNFNDVLLFGLFGVFFLIFTDYIYKLGKRSY